MEAEVKNNVTTKQTNHHRKEKKKCTKYEFSHEGKTVDSLIISHGFEVCHTEIKYCSSQTEKEEEISAYKNEVLLKFCGNLSVGIPAFMWRY